MRLAASGNDLMSAVPILGPLASLPRENEANSRFPGQDLPIHKPCLGESGTSYHCIGSMAMMTSSMRESIS